MARLIDADAFEKFLMNLPDEVLCEDCCYVVVNEMRNQPTIEPKQEWISVKDRLPERTLPPHDVLVYHDLNCGMFVDRAWYSYDMGKWCSVLGMKLKVTHWMPLPDPPKEGE